MYTFPKAKNVREIQLGVSNRTFKKKGWDSIRGFKQGILQEHGD